MGRLQLCLQAAGPVEQCLHRLVAALHAGKPERILKLLPCLRFAALDQHSEPIAQRLLEARIGLALGEIEVADEGLKPCGLGVE